MDVRGVTRKDKVRNEHIRGTTKVAQASNKITERRLKRYGHVTRREEERVVRRVMTKEGDRRWKDVCRRDVCRPWDRERARKETGRTGERARINNRTGDPR